MNLENDSIGQTFEKIANVLKTDRKFFFLYRFREMMLMIKARMIRADISPLWPMLNGLDRDGIDWLTCIMKMTLSNSHE